MAGAMPQGWHLVASGRSQAPHRWSGWTACEYLSFRHDSLRVIFPPGPAQFTMWLTPASYAGRLYESNRAQPGGAALWGISPSHLMFLEGGLPEEPDRSALEKLWVDRFGFRPSKDADLTPAARKTLAQPPPKAGGAALPGSELSVAEAMKTPRFQFAAV